MIMTLSDAIPLEARAGIADGVRGLTFVDGGLTAGWISRGVKHNEQAAQDEVLHGLQAQVLAALGANAHVASICFPARISPPMLSRYGPGMTYGDHIDDAVRLTDPPMRADISFTIFLSEPESYGGGDLVVMTPAGEARYKLPAGTAIFYPSNSLHRVEPVTHGSRLAVVGWIHSMIRSAEQRQLLYDLDLARRQVFQVGDRAVSDTLSKTYSNLLRMWADL